MRIMEIISAWGPGTNGATTACVQTIRALVARGHDVTVVCRPGGWVQRELADGGVDIVTSDLRRLPTTELKRIGRIVREKGIEVVHTHMSRAHFFGVLLRFFGKVPCVATAHNRYLQAHWMFNNRVIAVSEATRRFHRRVNLVRTRRIRVVHNFIDHDAFRAAVPPSLDGLRREFDLPGDAAIIGTVGEIVPRKGLLYLVQALPRILERVPQARLLVVGAGRRGNDYSDRVRAEAERLGVDGHILWAGNRGDVPALMALMDLFVLATVEDNLPIALLEAMALERAVVATRVGGLPECVVDGETGTLIQPRRPAELADAITALLTDAELRGRYGRAGRQRVSDHFSIASQVPEIERVLAETAALKRR